MNNRRLATIALTTALTATVLSSGASFAQSTGATSFEAQLNEAKSISLLDVERSERSTVATNLSVAEHLYAQGKQAQAEQYLNFARGLMGLETVTQSPSLQVGVRTGGHFDVN